MYSSKTYTEHPADRVSVDFIKDSEQIFKEDQRKPFSQGVTSLSFFACFVQTLET